ncbi:MAG: HIT family protein [bacterium]|nr:HIT family protein [bacterium]
MVPSAVLEKFGYPDTLVREYMHWIVLVQRKPLTLGALLVVYRDDATTLGGITSEAWTEFAQVMRDVEHALARVFAPDRINLLFLMMATPEAHAAILPRYCEAREFGGMTFTDPGWPRAPVLDAVHELTPEQGAAHMHMVRVAFQDVDVSLPV